MVSGGKLHLRYSIDSDVLIQAWRDYPIDNFPSVWNSLESMAERGIIGVSELILDELKRGGDDLYKWAKDLQSTIVIPTTAEIESEVAYLVNEYSNFGIITGKNMGDPFVVALARANNCSVVTNEKRSGNLNGPKIPDICLSENITWVRFVDIIKEQGLVF